MRISEAKACIKELYLNTTTVTALISERGVGKTSAYSQCAKELDIDYMTLYAAALEGPDFMGLPAKDLEKGITRYLAPQFLPTQLAIDHGLFKDKGLLILEEINRVPSDTISVLYPLLLEHKINGHALGKGWRIGVTMNPDTLNYLVNALDDAMLDRFISIHIEASLEDYLAYSNQHKPNSDVLNFLSSYPDMLLTTNKMNASATMSKAPTPRGWTKVQEIMNQCTLPSKLMVELISGIVGPVASAAFMGYLNDWQMDMPSSRLIVTNYGQERPKVLKLLEEKHTPILTKVIEKVVGLMAEEAEMVDQIDGFLGDLPDELTMYFFKVLSREREDIYDYYADRSLIFDRFSDLLLARMTS